MSVARTSVRLESGRLAKIAYCGSGPVVLYVHGWAHSAARWMKVAGATERGRFTHVAIDLPGFGHASSQNVAKPAIAHYAEFFAECVTAIARWSGEPIEVIVGHSLGACIVTRAYQSGGPQRNEPSLVLIGMPVTGIPVLRWLSFLCPLLLLLLFLRRVVPRSVSAMFIRLASLFTTPSFAAMDDQLVEDARRPRSLLLLRVLFAVAFFRVAERPRPRCSTLVLARGARDGICRAASMAVLANAWSAPAQTFAGVGHTPFMEAPTQFAGWLAGIVNREQRGD